MTEASKYALLAHKYAHTQLHMFSSGTKNQPTGATKTKRIKVNTIITRPIT